MKMFVKGGTIFLNINPYIVTNHVKGLLPEKMALRKSFYDIPGQNGGLHKLTSYVTSIACHLG